MNEVLNKIADIIEDYNNSQLDGVKLNNNLKLLTSYLYYIETIRTEAHERYEAVIYNKVKDGFSVARAKNEANVKVPEMYKLRRLLESGYRVADAMRTNISFLKYEINNTIKNY